MKTEKSNGTEKKRSEAVSDSAVPFSPYQVRVSKPYLNIRKGPGMNYDKTGKYTGIGTFTIVEESAGEGSSAGWGLLKSHTGKRNGWISLEHAERM